MSEKTLKSEYLYKGKIINVRKDTIELADGTRSTREIVEHSPAVVVLAFEKPDTLYLVRQYRKPLERTLLEATAGVMDEGEDSLHAAKRELLEETGIRAKRWTKLGENYTAPGFCTEKLIYFLAEELSHGKSQPDHDERIECVRVSVSEMAGLIANGEIIDSKTWLIYLMFLEHQKSKP